MPWGRNLRGETKPANKYKSCSLIWTGFFMDLKINVKCNPELALELRLNYPDSVLPGYHMNKKHWNTVVIDGLLSWKSIKEMIEHSYGLVGRKR